MATTDDNGRPERRQSQRVGARVEVRFKGPAEAARALKAYSLNFSVGGLCLKTKKTYEPGALLEVVLTVLDREVVLRAEVAWTRKGAIGARFVLLDDDDRRRLEELVEMLRASV